MQRSLSTIVLAVFSLLPLPAVAQDPYLGQKVFWKDGAQAKVGTTVVDLAKIPFPARVGKVEGDWLWLGRAWVRKRDVRFMDEALTYFTEEIRRNPGSARAWDGRGSVWDTKGEYDNAVKDYTEAIRLDPASAMAYNNRGWAWQNKQEYDNAIKDYTEAIRLNPVDAKSHNNRGKAWFAKQEYDNAVKDFSEAIRLDPVDAEVYNNIAWLRATCPNVKYLDGAEAVDMATKANELTAWTDLDCLDTLAAAYAECGDFAKAVEWQQKAIDMALEDDVKADFRGRLELYQAGKPYREERK
jgi:tetratricopeptide (TPR) repeat protein